MADIIKARARRGAIVQTAPVFEYDHGRRLAIYDTGLAATTPVHWSYDLADGTAAVGLATYNSEEDCLTAAIPSSMLKYGRGIDYKLYAFVYVETEDEGLTVYRFAVPVTARPCPDEGVPSEKEATLIEQAIASLGSFDIDAEETEDGCVVTITRPSGEKSVTIKGDKGDTGPKGDAGISPTATVTQTSSGAKITITDASGTTSADISNGSKGETGATGPKGDAGISPTATVTQTASGARIKITDGNGTTTANIYNGGTGSKGDKGDAGVSPTVNVTQTSSGARITITDASGTTTANISNGSKGDTGATGPQGPAGTTPVKGTDYFTPSDISDIVDDVIAALNNADTTGY